MEEKREVAVRAVVIKVISSADDHAEIMVQTVVDDSGRMKSTTRHIHKQRGGGWSGINSSNEVVEAHKTAAAVANEAEKQYEAARLALGNAEKANKEAVAKASKDAGDRVRKAAEDAKTALEKAEEFAADANKKLEAAKKKQAALEKKTPLQMSYALDIHSARYA